MNFWAPEDTRGWNWAVSDQKTNQNAHTWLNLIAFCEQRAVISFAEKMTGVVKHLFSWLYGRSDCTDVNHFRYEMPKETFHIMLTIRYPSLGGKGGGDADLSLVTSCRSLKMHTDHSIYQCPVQKTVNNARTNGKTRNITWSNWEGLKSVMKTHYFKPDQIRSGTGKSMFRLTWWKISFSPDVILCGWLGLKHQLTN